MAGGPTISCGGTRDIIEHEVLGETTEFANLLDYKNGEKGCERIIAARIELAGISPHPFDMRNESFVLCKAGLKGRPRQQRRLLVERFGPLLDEFRKTASTVLACKLSRYRPIVRVAARLSDFDADLCPERRGAGAVKRGGLEMRLDPSLPSHLVPPCTRKCGFLRFFGYRGGPLSRSIPSCAKALGANLGAKGELSEVRDGPASRIAALRRETDSPVLDLNRAIYDRDG
jgi:hypothetical protein